LAIIAIASVVAIAVIAFVLSVGPRSVPEPEPVSPFAHLDERKAAIYENLRDLQFEYRVGKLSDEDYQSTKRDLQKELAAVLAEVDRVRNGLPVAAPPAAVVVAPPAQAAAPVPVQAALTPQAAPQKPAGFACESCGATFEKPLKFCGECGKPMKAGTA
jgi:hypothetical protein